KLVDAHPPFQIDWNFRRSSGIAEMLLQSHEPDPDSKTGGHVLELLPALPSAWPKGAVHGLRARDGFELDLAWNDGKLTQVKVHSSLGNACKLRLKDRLVTVPIKKGATVTLNGELK